MVYIPLHETTRNVNRLQSKLYEMFLVDVRKQYMDTIPVPKWHGLSGLCLGTACPGMESRRGSHSKRRVLYKKVSNFPIVCSPWVILFLTP